MKLWHVSGYFRSMCRQCLSNRIVAADYIPSCHNGYFGPIVSRQAYFLTVTKQPKIAKPPCWKCIISE